MSCLRHVPNHITPCRSTNTVANMIHYKFSSSPTRVAFQIQNWEILDDVMMTQCTARLVVDSLSQTTDFELFVSFSFSPLLSRNIRLHLSNSTSLRIAVFSHKQTHNHELATSQRPATTSSTKAFLTSSISLSTNRTATTSV